mmetsp:Transcript_43904/g.114512  ORF Transcript_43904/g.114512 Transcript_43904/m.114512 type:complete len:400 (-) Transcript_43904:3450-4649(-)
MIKPRRRSRSSGVLALGAILIVIVTAGLAILYHTVLQGLWEQDGTRIKSFEERYPEFFHGEPQPPLQHRYAETTLCTHMSVDRFERLYEHARRWPGPIAVSVYVKTVADMHKYEEVFKNVTYLHGGVNHTIVYSIGDDYYPINEMRNAAWQLVQTEMILLLDVDLIPDEGLYGFIARNYEKFQPRLHSHAFVVPAFDVKATLEPPRNYQELMQMKGDGNVKPVLYDEETGEYHPSHRCFKYENWYTETKEIDMKYRWPCEPYIFGGTESMPRYDERFTSYGNNKVVHIFHLAVLGFQLKVIPRHFITHVSHSVDPTFNWHKNGDEDEKNRMASSVAILTKQFEYELMTNLGINYRTGKKFKKGSYISGKGTKLEWNGEMWVDRKTGKPTLPYDIDTLSN